MLFKALSDTFPQSHMALWNLMQEWLMVTNKVREMKNISP